MPLVDIADETFVRAAPAEVAAVVANPASWRLWWPELTLTVTRDRGVKGQQWTAQGTGHGGRRLAGTLEIWLEPWGDGVIVHLFARLDPVDDTPPARWAERERARRVRTWKRYVHALKDVLESR